MRPEPLTLATADGIQLEAELAVPDEPRAGAVLAHPHPLHGGNMRSIVPGALFEALPAAGVAALRFNFRGVGGSTGSFSDGVGEADDVLAALDALHEILEGVPLVLAGWSFGGDTSLTVSDWRVAGWFAVAPPLRGKAQPAMASTAGDARPKMLAVPEHDQFRPPDSARQVVEGWTNTTIEVVRGADHFLVGRTSRVADLCLAFIGRLS